MTSTASTDSSFSPANSAARMEGRACSRTVRPAPPRRPGPAGVRVLVRVAVRRQDVVDVEADHLHAGPVGPGVRLATHWGWGLTSTSGERSLVRRGAGEELGAERVTVRPLLVDRDDGSHPRHWGQLGAPLRCVAQRAPAPGLSLESRSILGHSAAPGLRLADPLQ